MRRIIEDFDIPVGVLLMIFFTITLLSVSLCDWSANSIIVAFSTSIAVLVNSFYEIAIEIGILTRPDKAQHNS